MQSSVNYFLAMILVLATLSNAKANEFVIDSNTYAAIAYSPASGRYGYAYDYRSRWSAEQAAIRNCKAEDAKVVCWVNAGWWRVALGDDRTCYGVGVTHGDGSKHSEARRRAIEDCQKRTTGAHVALFLLSDGQLIYTVNGDKSTAKAPKKMEVRDAAPLTSEISVDGGRL